MSALWTHLVLNLWQVGFILLFSPLVEGVLHRLEEIIQGKSGVSVWQTYRDIWKLFAKDEVISEQSTWVFRFAPIVAFVMPLFVVLLIPALTAYPLFFAFMGDMVAVGFLMAISGFFVALGGMDTGNLYAAVGASRTFSAAAAVGCQETTGPGAGVQSPSEPMVIFPMRNLFSSVRTAAVRPRWQRHQDNLLGDGRR